MKHKGGTRKQRGRLLPDMGVPGVREVERTGKRGEAAKSERAAPS